MKKIIAILLITLVTVGGATLLTACNDKPEEGKTVVDLLGREVVVPDEVNRVVCIGAGALRLYSYVGDMTKLSGVEDVDKDGTAVGGNLAMRPYKTVYANILNSLPSCGIGGPQNQYPESEKILMCNPDVIFSLYTSDASAMDKLQSEIGVPVVTLSYGRTEAFDINVRKSLELIGTVTGNTTRAEEVVKYIEDIAAELSAIGQKVSDDDKPKVYLACQSNYGIHGFEASTANYSLFNASGIKNVMDIAGYSGFVAEVDYEILLTRANPDKVIIDAGGLGIFRTQYSDSDKRAVFDKINAIASGEVYLQLPYNAYYTNLEIAYSDAYFDACVAYPEQMSGFDYVGKAREIYTFFLGKDVYDDLAAVYGNFGKLDIGNL